MERMQGIIPAWGRILAGYRPNLSIEITRECPLRCPGCYAYGDEHLGGGLTLRQLADRKGPALVDGVIALIDRYRPIHVSIVGGEPLVRYRELTALLPTLSSRGIHTQVVTSAVRPIPAEWSRIPKVQVCVSIDGLQPEHDERRKPATYARILKHIVGQQVTVHCTVTRQQVRRDGYIEEFVRTWSANEHVRRIWISLYTPQVGEQSEERLLPADRARAVAELRRLSGMFPKLQLPQPLIAVYERPPASPEECIFAKTTDCVSADFTTPITPCQFGGTPDCENCGCMASAGLGAVGRHRLGGLVPIGAIFNASLAIGRAVKGVRDRLTPDDALPPAADFAE